jgi:glycosyltransferase involved in cell wall biosynthesis
MSMTMNGNERVQRLGGAAKVLALSIVVPTKNEADNVAPLVEELEQAFPQERVEIIFVDDSTDGTPEAVRAVAQSARHEVKLIHRDPEKRTGGLSGAVVRGIEAARADHVCVMDGDLQHPPALVPQLLAAAHETGADMVVASRYCTEDKRVESFRIVRAAVSKVSGAAAKFFFRGALRDVTDPLSGFFLVRREAVDLGRLRPRGFKILLEILARTPHLRVTEVPFTFGIRHAGESKASVGQGLTYLRQVLDLRFAGRIGRFVRFGVVGASGIGVNVAAFAALLHWAGFHYLLAAVLSTQVSTAWNFALTEGWVFRDRRADRPGSVRLVLFFAMNNLALALRGPMLVLLIAGLALNDVLANFITLVALTLIRFTVSDGWIWGERGAAKPRPAFFYRIHGVITIESEVRLRELERFRVGWLDGRAMIRVRLGTLSRAQSELVKSLAFLTRHIRYDEGLGRFGFGAEIAIGKSIEVVASPMLRFSPHVLYTNVVEPILRWTFVEKGYALIHAACIADRDDAYLITARTDTGKTTTILKLLRDYPYSFLSDDLTLVAPDGRVFTYPKPLTISRHTAHAVSAPLRFAERLGLFIQSRVHSRSGRQFAMLLSRTGLPVATINAVVQLLIPPPKYHVERLVPGVRMAREAKLAGLIVIQRANGTSEVRMDEEEAVETLTRNTDDAYTFPPYPSIEHFLHSGNGRDLRAEECRIIARALANVPAAVLQSDAMDWWQRIPAFLVRRPAIAAGPSAAEHHDVDGLVPATP